MFCFDTTYPSGSILPISSAQDSCSLGSAFARICATIARRSGKLPFTLLCISRAQFLENGAQAKEFQSQIEPWKKASKERKYFENDLINRGIADQYRPASDLVAGGSHYIIFEGVDEGGRLNPQPSSRFENNFINTLTRDVPSISIVTLGDTNMQMSVHDWAQQTRRGFPVLLLDSRDREFQSSIDEAKEELVAWETQLNEDKISDRTLTTGVTGTKIDCYNASRLAYLHGAMKEELERNHSY